MIFLFEEKMFFFSRYLDFCVFVKSTNFIMVAAPPILERDLKILDQNNWGDLSKKLNLGGS